MRRLFSTTILAIAVLLLFGTDLMAEDFGMIMDTSGKISLNRQGKKIKAEIGQTLFAGDSIRLDKGSSLVLVSYELCEEWIIDGPLTLTFTEYDIIADKDPQPEPGRQLPVCYSLDEMSTTDSDTLGALVLRGSPDDPVRKLRMEFNNGQASNSTLMALILHEIKNGSTAQAEPFFQELKKRAPDSAFIKKMEHAFQ